MNPLNRLLSLSKKNEKKAEDSAAHKKWLEGYEAFERGRNHYLKHAIKEALDCFDKAIECGLGDEFDVYSLRGTCLQALNFDIDAIDDFNKAIASEPEDSNLYFMRSISRGATGDLHGCVSDLEEAIRVAGVGNAANISYNGWAKEHGYNGIIDKYKLDLFNANLSLEMQASDELRRRKHPNLDLGPDVASRRRAESRRRTQHDRTA
jgi:tetratricopeptide (TPR) repeat protein